MDHFSIRNIFSSYTLKDVLSDTIIPFIVSTGLCILIDKTGSDILEQLSVLVSLGLDIVPAMTALLFSAYAIIITFFADSVFQSVKDKDKGKILIDALNGSFCLYLLVSIISIIIMMIISIVTGLKIISTYSIYINFTIYWSLSFLLTFSVVTLIGVIIDIYDCGRTMTI